jgi:hypothetical protein
MIVPTRLTLVLLAAAVFPAWTAEPSADEYRVKGAFLLNFARFVDWPPRAFKSPADPISICILGANPFGPVLEQAAHAALVENRGVAVRQIAEPQQAGHCHIAFVSAAERKRSHALLDAVRGGNVLTVGEFDGFISGGGVIDFSVEESRVRIEIGTAAADRAGLHISAKLLSLAQAGKK